MNKRCLVWRWSCCNLIALLQQCFCASGLCVGVAVNGAERFAGSDFVADLLMDDDAYGGIDRIFFALAASAEDDAGGADLFARDSLHVSGLAAGHIDAVICARETRRIVDRADVASLQLDHLPESFEGFAGGDDLFGELLAFGNPLRPAPQIEHPRLQFEPSASHIGRADSWQVVCALLHYERCPVR